MKKGVKTTFKKGCAKALFRGTSSKVPQKQHFNI